MTIDDVIVQVVAATQQALADGSLSTYTPVEQVSGILGLDSFRSVDPVVPADPAV